MNKIEKKFNRSSKQSKNIKRNQKKTYNVMSKDPYNSSNSSSQNNKIISPPWLNMPNNRSNILPNYPKRKPNLISEEYNRFNKKTKKIKKENNYKHNKSLENISLNNDILLQYKIESPLIPGNIDNCGNEILEILNLNGDNNAKANANINNNSNKIKKVKNQKLNNSYILQNKYKSILNENNSYENRNRNEPKMNENETDYQNNPNYDNFYKNKKENPNKIKNIDLINDDFNNKEYILDQKEKQKDNLLNYNTLSHREKISTNSYNNNFNKMNTDEYLLNSSFENNKNDFALLYNNNYHKNIKNDMLFMENQLLIEKILELQKSYHQEYKNLLSRYKKERKRVKFFHEKNIFLKKKKINLFKIKEKNNLVENNKLYIELDDKRNIIIDSTKINKKEIHIWNKMFPIKVKSHENNYNKNKLKIIFKNSVFDKYKLISYKLNDIEKNIINRLIKKYQYQNNNLNSYNNISSKKDKKNKKKNIVHKTNYSNSKGKNIISRKVNENIFSRTFYGNNNFKFNIKNKLY